MRNIKCSYCEEYRNEWCEKVIDSPHPDILRDCQYFHEAKTRWIPVTERLPERCNYYIVTDFDKVDEAYYNSDGRWFSWDGNKLKDVTAWMPLPEPYKEEQE